MSISASIILDSECGGSRLTTMELEFPRFILAEFNTHRVFSRNSASSRAIPVAKILERVVKDPYIPIKWGSNRPGMQAGDVLPDQSSSWCEENWLTARDQAVFYVQRLLDEGLHKQWANRLLEPFMWHKVIVTSSEWENFFDQRCSPLAQPEMEELARQMRDALYNSEPQELAEYQWHLPYVTGYDETEIPVLDQPAVSAARCARVSYLNHDGKRDLSADTGLYDKLLAGQHASPLEHPAKASPRGSGDRNFGPYWLQLRQLEHL